MISEYKMVIVTREDLKLSVGKLAAQVAHAAVACALMTKKNKSKWYALWEKQGGKKIVVTVPVLEDFNALIKAGAAIAPI